MKKVVFLLWTCYCGGIGDERDFTFEAGEINPHSDLPHPYYDSLNELLGLDKTFEALLGFNAYKHRQRVLMWQRDIGWEMERMLLHP